MCPVLLLQEAHMGGKHSSGRDWSHLTRLYEGEFPKVLIQLPMYNEDAHCDLIIERCCKIAWPNHRLLIQVGVWVWVWVWVGGGGAGAAGAGLPGGVCGSSEAQGGVSGAVR
jgi:hypothetical protein